MTLRTDHDIVQLPKVIPDFGGLYGRNRKQVDNDFNMVITRITDGGDANFQTLQTNDSSERNTWNTDASMIRVKTTGSATLLYQFNTKTMKATKLPYSFKGKLGFSHVSPGVLFQLSDAIIYRHTFRKVNGVWTFFSTSTVANFANILPVGFDINWTGTFHFSIDDKTFVVAFSEGQQNTAIHACVFQKGHGIHKGYRMLNTQTGTVIGDWGQTGTAVINSPDNSKHFPFMMHEASCTPNSRYAKLGAKDDTDPNNEGQLIWVIDSLNITDRNVSGHAAEGYLHIYAGGPGGGQVAEVPYDNLNTRRLIVPKDQLPAAYGQTFHADTHYSFGNLPLDDNSSFWVTSKTDVIPFVSCWANEVFSYQSMSGEVHRACHTFSSPKSHRFIVANAIAAPSQDGRFVAFTSDMMGTLGSESGTENGVIGVDARGDVFVISVV